MRCLSMSRYRCFCVQARPSYTATAIILCIASLCLPRSARGQGGKVSARDGGAPSSEAASITWPDLLHVRMVTRPQLDSLANKLEASLPGQANAEVGSKMRGYLNFLRYRLTYGDFQPGDHFFISVGGPVTSADTVAVREGNVVELPQVGEIHVGGVLRSELQGHLEKEVARYVRGATVHSSALLRLSILGSVAKPGFYMLPADIALSDVVMRAGGPTSQTDLARSEIRRDSKAVFVGQDVAVALGDGMTLDQLGLRDGDVLTIGEKRSTNWPMLFQVFTFVASIGLAVYGFSRR